MMAPSLCQQSKSSHNRVPIVMLTASSEDAMSTDSPSPSPPSGGSLSTTGATSTCDKSQCSSMSDGESYECIGEGVDLELGPAGSLTHPQDGVDSRSPGSGNAAISRHSWSRTSLRRTPSSTNKRQLSTNALASQLYRSSSFNSSGRSSIVDTGEEMYSDVSLEEDVLDLNHKVQMLQQQVTTLADTQTNTDDRYTRVKTDNAVLQTRVHMLEEQLRDIELRGDERIQEEQRRHKEIIVRVEREAQLKQENCTIRLHTLELECVSLREEAARLRSQNDKQKTEIVLAEDRLEEARGNWALAQQELDDALTREKKLLAAKDQSDQLMQELSLEIERLRADHCLPALPTTMPEQLRLEELHEEMKSLREKNQNLKETNEELEAEILSRSVEEGRTLLNGTSNSLAAEFEAMSHDQMQKTMRDLQDENVRLRSYIDDILLNIVENYPQLLEVKRH